jgi:hypothetical protein
MATEQLSHPTPVRFRQKDLERMDVLARRFGGSRSALVRHLVAEGLDLELDRRKVA